MTTSCKYQSKVLCVSPPCSPCCEWFRRQSAVAFSSRDAHHSAQKGADLTKKTNEADRIFVSVRLSDRKQHIYIYIYHVYETYACVINILLGRMLSKFVPNHSQKVQSSPLTTHKNVQQEEPHAIVR